MLGKNPKEKFLGISHTGDMAQDIGQRVRDTIASEEYAQLYPGIRLRQDSRAKRKWHTNHGGLYNAAGIGMAITGKRANIALVDDPVPGREEAQSALWVKKFRQWWTSNFYTRINPGGAIIVIMQRWEVDDPVGWLLDREKTRERTDKWTIVNMPALANEHGDADDNGKHPLWPERYTLDVTLGIKDNIDSREWASQWQQKPEMAGGTIFKREWFKFWSYQDGGQYATRRLPDFPDDSAQSWDMTFKETKSGSFVCGQVWLRKGADVFLIYQTREQMDFVRTLESFRNMTGLFPQVVGKLVENKANGPAVIASLKHEIGGIIPIEPEGSKVSRAYSVQPMFKAGNVYIPLPTMQGFGWVEDYIAEMTNFNGAGNQRNDQVDCTTQVINYWKPRKKGILDAIANLR